MTDQSLYENHVLHVCSALGGIEDGEYKPGDEVIDCLRDLKRFLRMDEEEESKESHSLLSRWNIVESDLIPMLLVAQSKGNIRLGMGVCEILVPITWPSEETKTLETGKHDDRLLLYKKSFVAKGVWKAVLWLIVYYCSKQNRSENDESKLRLLLCLVRNILAINDNTSAIQEDLIRMMKSERLVDFLVSLAASTSQIQFRTWNTLLLESFYWMFEGRIVTAFKESSNNLKLMLMKEENSRKGSTSRHARFGGTFTLKTNHGSKINVRSIPLSTGFAFDKNKKVTRAKRPVDIFLAKPLTHSPAILRSISNDFLDNCFNYLLPSVKRDFDVERAGLKKLDYHSYFSLLSFFLDYHLTFSSAVVDFERITASINHQTLLFTLKRITIYREEKNYRSLYCATRTLQQLIRALERMDECEDDGVKQASMQIQSQLFYEQDHLRAVVMMVTDKRLTSKLYLECVVDIVGRIFKLIIRNWSTGSGGGIVTRRLNKVGGMESGNDSDGDAEVRSSERVFSLDRFHLQFAQDNVIETYCTLLNHVDSLSDETIDQIRYLFEVISSTEHCNREALFYDLGIFLTFHEVLQSKGSEALERLKTLLRLITDTATSRILERPGLVMHLFYSKTLRDCSRIQNGDEIDEIEVIEEVQLSEREIIHQFGFVDGDVGARGEQIRKLAGLMEGSSEGRDFIKWLSLALRRLYYDDLDDLVEDPNIENLFLSHFGNIPFGYEEYIKRIEPELMLPLLGFETVGQDWMFPKDLDIVTIEHLERAKLFRRREPPVAKKKRKSMANDVVAAVTKTRRNNVILSDSDEDEGNAAKVLKTAKSAKTKVVRESVEKEAIAPKVYKSEHFVINSSDEEGDAEFFRLEAELRSRKAHEHVHTSSVSESITARPKASVKVKKVSSKAETKKTIKATKKAGAKANVKTKRRTVREILDEIEVVNEDTLPQPIEKESIETEPIRIESIVVDPIISVVTLAEEFKQKRMELTAQQQEIENIMAGYDDSDED